jgi:hypothetical protein
MNKEKKMMIQGKHVWLIVVLSAILITGSANSAYSLDEGDFDELEYHLLLQNIDIWDPASGLPAALVDQLDEMFVFDDEAKHYKVMYIDTNDRALGEGNLILRVRARMDKPKKSKITLKSRSADVADVLDIAACDDRKYEIDISGTDQNYAVSSDIEYHGIDDEELNVNAITPASVLAYIQDKCPSVFSYLTPIENNPEAQIPGIVDRYQFEGTLADDTHPLYDDPTFDFELWVFAPDQYIVELAFGGDVEDREALYALYEELKTFFEAQNLLNPEQFSKTGFYFEFFALPDVQPGDVFSYLITYTNLFDDDVYVNIFDTLDELVSYEPGTFTVNGESVLDSYFSGGLLDYDHPAPLSSNETLRFAFDVRVSDIASAGQIIENVAQVTAYTDLSDPSGSVVDQVETNYTRIEVVPEPSTLIFLGIGMLGLLAFVRKKNDGNKN